MRSVYDTLCEIVPVTVSNSHAHVFGSQPWPHPDSWPEVIGPRDHRDWAKLLTQRTTLEEAITVVGLQPDSVKVTIDGNVLTITCDRTLSVTKEITVPAEVDPSTIQAKIMGDTIHVTSKPKKAKKIQITVEKVPSK